MKKNAENRHLYKEQLKAKTKPTRFEDEQLRVKDV